MPARIKDSWGNWHDMPDLENPEGGGGVTVDNTVDAPAEVTTLLAPGATINGTEATLPLQVRLLGPFTFDGAEDDVIGGVALVGLPEGALVIDAWAVVSSNFTTIPGPALANIAIGVGTLVGSDWADVVVRTGAVNESTTWAASPLVPDTTQRLAQAKTGASLIAYVFSEGDPSGQGVAEIYALIAVPAS